MHSKSQMFDVVFLHAFLLGVFFVKQCRVEETLTKPCFCFDRSWLCFSTLRILTQNRMVAILGQRLLFGYSTFFGFPTLFLLTPPLCEPFRNPFLLNSLLLQKMAAPIQMLRTSTQEFTDPTPPVLAPAMELRLFVALSPVQFAMLTDRRPILPDPYSLRFGLRSDPLKAY